MAAREHLKDALAAYDGKAVSILSEIAVRHAAEKTYIDAAIALCADPDEIIAGGASWLLKHHLDEGGAFTPRRTDAIVNACPAANGWSAALHLCQMIGRLKLKPAHAGVLRPWLAALLSHQRPFVRAWSLDALCALAPLDAQSADAARKALAAAAKDPAASVRARARNLKPASTLHT